MRECDYPPCHEQAVRPHSYFNPGPQVFLCAEHSAMLHRNLAAEDDDFWRWAKAMLSQPERPGGG
jgi:hypothetical protein